MAVLCCQWSYIYTPTCKEGKPQFSCMWTTTLLALVFSLTVIYIITVSLVVWDPGNLVSSAGNTTIASGNKYEQSTRYETALIGNTLVITVISVLTAARAMSYVGECIVKVAHHYVAGEHATGHVDRDKEVLVPPYRSSSIRL